MAEEIAITGSGARAKKRNPLGVFGLTLITLGIYHFFWWYYVNKEMVELGKAKGTTEMGENATTSLLALFPGFLIIVPPFVSYYRGVKRMQAAARHTGAEPLNGWLALIIFLVPIVNYFFSAFLQSELNKVWDAQSPGTAAIPPAGEPAATPQAEPAQPAPPPEQSPPAQ